MMLCKCNKGRERAKEKLVLCGYLGLPITCFIITISPSRSFSTHLKYPGTRRQFVDLIAKLITMSINRFVATFKWTYDFQGCVYPGQGCVRILMLQITSHKNSVFAFNLYIFVYFLLNLLNEKKRFSTVKPRLIKLLHR